MQNFTSICIKFPLGSGLRRPVGGPAAYTDRALSACAIGKKCDKVFFSPPWSKSHPTPLATGVVNRSRYSYAFLESQTRTCVTTLIPCFILYNVHCAMLLNCQAQCFLFFFVFLQTVCLHAFIYLLYVFYRSRSNNDSYRCHLMHFVHNTTVHDMSSHYTLVQWFPDTFDRGPIFFPAELRGPTKFSTSNKTLKQNARPWGDGGVVIIYVKQNSRTEEG